MHDIHSEKILILDFGSQYTKLIARRVREAGVYCEIFSHSASEKEMKDFAPKGIILSGGPESAHVESSPKAGSFLFEMNCPILGICYGMQTMAKELGGQILSSEIREFGRARVHYSKSSKLFDGIKSKDSLDVWMSHGDRISSVPKGFKISAFTKDIPIAAMENAKRSFYGVQFHPEVTHTSSGKLILENFLFKICKCSPNWTTKNIVEDILESIKRQVKGENVILGLSGGVDSSVVAALLSKAIGDQLTCIFVDTGLLRLGEAKQVKKTFPNAICIDARDKFFHALKGICDPEEKRKTVGRLFIDVFSEEAKKRETKFLAQGTIYPDVIESACSSEGGIHSIKSHHNVGGLPEELNLDLVEPLRELFKDEVRSIGLELGLSKEMVYRHPFPGPGLAVRILGEVKPKYAELLRKADHILIEELHNYDYYYKVSQAFVVFLPIKSVGVMGDARKYEYVVAIRVVETVDFMTARWADLPHEFLAKVSSRIINEISGISRVTYDISDKPPATIEWE